MFNDDELFDFRAFGRAVKQTRQNEGMTRKEAAEKIPIDPRYLTNIENKGQHPSLQVFYRLATMFNLSVDQYFYPGTAPDKSTLRRQLDSILDSFDDNDLIIVDATAKGIIQAKEVREP